MPRIEGGFVLLARRLADPEQSWLWKLSGDHLKVWIYMLVRARWQAGTDRWWDGVKQVSVGRGEFIGSQVGIAAACGVSRKIVRALMEKLGRDGTIRATPGTGSGHSGATRYWLISICNFEAYQSPDSYAGQARDRLGPAAGRGRATPGPDEGHARATEEEVEEGKKQQEENTKTTAPPARRARKPRALSVSYSPDFEAFWLAYPRKEHKGAAWRAWKTAGIANGALPEVLAGLDRWKSSELWGREDGRYICHGSTWINGRSWEDEPRRERKLGEW